ncbi:hypothetical protein A3F03_00560 [Candidatus Roizmanbacteria bacterium RIFCSPHIGHO2_12_FULL_41_11]|uniref:NYN domain-containing protein n=2 Tax=Candidatus Roizmaniibacteriota TaxID=1752723 RepID=A0A1F7J7K4_9BACT|nr:MAG: hypothetical protein A3F03_00560 [Candidatus Roizmanbacteria bacterium RIFCSPHIGHO2_12_FULL_41_11]OGK51590.1 MAG: hypothetical protein A2966_02965 [Candidatus Roizmanbacteria bacterium RIFCSPLOWO2_01_FULL_41_22]
MTKLKASIFIDGANVFYTQKHLGWNVDWKRVTQLLSKEFNLIETRYYTGIKNHDEKMKKFLSSLRKIGIKTVTKPLKLLKDKHGGFLYKSNCDVEMAVDILLDVNSFDVLVLFSGDSDFVHLINILQKQFQKKVVVYSTRKTVAWELKLTADKYYFLEDIKATIKR